MQKTRKNETLDIVKLAVDTKELAAMLSCGEYSARKIGEESNARLDFGTRRTLWNVRIVQAYLDSIAC